MLTPHQYPVAFPVRTQWPGLITKQSQVCGKELWSACSSAKFMHRCLLSPLPPSGMTTLSPNLASAAAAPVSDCLLMFPIRMLCEEIIFNPECPHGPILTTGPTISTSPSGAVLRCSDLGRRCHPLSLDGAASEISAQRPLGSAAATAH